MTTHNDSLVFLTVRGTLVPKTLEEGRRLHNETAGTPEGIAAARGLGDLSHKVYAPVPGTPGTKDGELLFFDWWKTAEGIGTFFSDAHVQQMASKLFSQREGTVWTPARGAFGFELPAPASRSERYVGMVRGSVASPEKAVDVFRSVLAGKLSEARKRGQLSHALFVKMPTPGPAAGNASEVLGIDLWADAEGMMQHYGELKGFEQAFSEAPRSSVWTQASGLWNEW